MDDKLRSEVMDDIDGLKDSYYESRQQIGDRFQEVMTAYEHLELQMLQAKRIIGAIVEAHTESWETTDIDFSLISHAKAFLEENDG